MVVVNLKGSYRLRGKREVISYQSEVGVEILKFNRLRKKSRITTVRKLLLNNDFNLFQMA